MAAALRRFIDDRAGGAAIELAVWLPVFFSFALFAIDASIFLFRYSQMWDATRDAARAVAVGAIPATEAAVNAHVQARLTGDYDGRIVVDGPTSTVVVDASMQTMSLFGFLVPVVSDLSTRATMTAEPSF